MKMNLANNNSYIPMEEENNGYPPQLYVNPMWQSQQVYDNAPVELPMDVRQRILANAYMQDINTKNEIVRMNYEYSRRERQDVLKENLEERKMMVREEIRQKRELLSCGIIENSDGFLCRELVSAEGKTVGIKPIVKIQNIRMVIFFSHPQNDGEKAYVIQWDGSEKKICLAGANATAEKMEREFLKVGIVFQTSREYRKNLMNLVWGYLVSHAIEIEIPRAYGWNKLSTGQWFFAKRGIDETMKGLIE